MSPELLKKLEAWTNAMLDRDHYWRELQLAPFRAHPNVEKLKRQYAEAEQKVNAAKIELEAAAKR